MQTYPGAETVAEGLALFGNKKPFTPRQSKQPLVITPGQGFSSIQRETRYSFLLPYFIGLVSGVAIMYIVTMIIGYIINKATPSSQVLRKAYYGYMLGCSGP